MNVSINQFLQTTKRSAFLGSALNIMSLLLILLLSGCAARLTTTDQLSTTTLVVKDIQDNLLHRYAPVFVMPGYQKLHNRIGRVEAEIYQDREIFSINTKYPTYYGGTHSFSTQRGSYINLIYRIHFSKTPFSLIPFHLTAGNLPGILVILTFNDQQELLLVTTAGTCGCYATIIPTTQLSQEAFPENWPDNTINVYGETLPAHLEEMKENSLIQITMRPDIHRVMNIGVVQRRDFTTHSMNTAEILPIESLRKLPLTDGNSTSFYYDTWPLTGHVKGAIKPWESLLLSLISLDFYIGMDKEYGDTEISDNPFYTSILPWNRKKSDMNNFTNFLHFFGWNL